MTRSAFLKLQRIIENANFEYELVSGICYKIIGVFPHVKWKQGSMHIPLYKSVTADWKTRGIQRGSHKCTAKQRDNRNPEIRV